MSKIKNQVLADDARTSQNFYESDGILRYYLKKHLHGASLEYMSDKLHWLGEQAATEMNALSLAADRQPPTLKKRTKFGEPANEIEFHPAYWKLMDIAARSEMFYVQYERGLREKFSGERHSLGFAAGQLYAMSELGAYCPLCMTDGAAHLVDRFAPEALKKRLLPKLSSRTGEGLFSGAMFLTEKSGGSDVGRNLAIAEKVEGNLYRLSGEKWFCSNVNADVIMTLARTGDIDEGTRGLSLFLVEKKLEDGRRNPMEIIRLKDKFGVKSMATGEVRFDDTFGILLGEENNGFKLMAEMINISRMYNSVGAIAVTRRAIIEAYQYLNHRITFGKKAIEHALIRQKFHELGAKYIGDFLLVWRAIGMMDAAVTGDEDSRQLMRMLVPMAKWKSAEQGVYSVRECMELIGGNGYIEDFVMPKLLRDVNVLPIWEGSGNIIVLDILRAAQKSDGLKIIINQIKEAAKKSEEYGSRMQNRLEKLQAVYRELEKMENSNRIEATAKPLCKELIQLYEMSLMIEELNDTTESWIRPALDYFTSEFEQKVKLERPISRQEVDALIAWNY